MTDILYACIEGSVNVINKSAQILGLQKKTGIEIDVRALEKQIVDQVGMGATGPARHLIRLAGLSGAVAVSMAAYGEHGLKPKDEEEQKLKKIFDVGNKMHLIHSVALLACPASRKPILTGVLMTTGIVVFCGSCYAHALTRKKEIVLLPRMEA
uniref:Putative transmembrane protein 256-like protein n=1 Tax=Pinctada fucata TaxID=50426 RepID=A0A194ANL2_PINFU